MALLTDADPPPVALVKAFFGAALRRVRLQAAVALGEQNHHAEAERARIETLHAEAVRDEDTARIRARVAGVVLPLDVLVERLRLRPVDEALLMCAVALEADPLFAITVSALGAGEPRQGLTAKLVAQVLRFAGDEALDLRLDGAHPLVEAGLLESPVAAGVPESLRPFRASGRGVSFLAGSVELDPLLSRCGGVVPVPEDVDTPATRDAWELLDRLLLANEDVIVCVEGSEGVGRRTAVAVAAARTMGREAVALDAGRLSPDPLRFQAELRALRRECWLRGAVPIVARLDALSRRDVRPGERFVEVAEMLEARGAVPGPAVVTCAPGTELPDFQRRVVRLRLDPPGAPARALVWSKALADRMSDPAAASTAVLVEELPRIAQRYALTPGGIRRAAANARALASGRALDPADVHRGIAAEIQERFSGLATRVTISQRWDDLVLPQDTLDEVRAFISRASNAALVYERWGFRAKLQRGLGLAALFSGPPGTGKTMIAGLIAQALGLELYMVDLSQIVSKWVGETEKQLGKIFDAAAMGQALLLFDEADALFAKRTEVKSSNDRYANLEVNYLLQKIEAFGGVAILTTNLEASVDPAFKRRLAADVRFYPPDLGERERLWRTMIPSLAPLDDKTNFKLLAETFKEMCGGHIRNAVLRAAFLAAAESKSIGQELLVRAGRSEYRAMGKVL